MYHSRISSPHQIKALPEKHAVCLTFGEATRGTCEVARERLRTGGAVMLDNGAFSAFKRGEAMTREVADKVLNWYDTFVGIGPDLICVAPDVIGDATATVRLQTDLSARLRDLTSKARLIVPVQGFDISLAAAGWKSATDLIGPSIIAGVPSSRVAWSDDQVRQFVHLTGCSRMHFLGGSSKTRRNLAAELGLDASSDSGFASISSANTKGRMQNLPRFCALAERRVAGTGAKFFVKHGQARWPWAF